MIRLMILIVDPRGVLFAIITFIANKTRSLLALSGPSVFPVIFGYFLGGDKQNVSKTQIVLFHFIKLHDLTFLMIQRLAALSKGVNHKIY